jgi:fucose permease
MIPKVCTTKYRIKICASLGIVFSLAAILTPVPYCSYLAISVIGTFQAVELTIPLTVLFIRPSGHCQFIVRPAIWPLAITVSGDLTKQTSAMLIMAIAEAALLPMA